jgi:hypothetical protein
MQSIEQGGFGMGRVTSDENDRAMAAQHEADTWDDEAVVHEELSDEPADVACQWFALCENPATGATSHPILGNVATCDRCNRFATTEGR